MIIALLVVVLAGGGALAATREAFWQEFDITFWQTIPWASFWSYAAASQLARGGEVNWSPVINVALAVSLANAYLHARKVTN